MTLIQKEPSSIKLGSTDIKAVYLGENKVRPSGPDKDYLCFTAEEANSTVKLKKNGTPTSVSLETSTDGKTWSDYTSGTWITLTNVGDKVYWRNKSETTTGFSTSSSNYYYFVMTGTISASGDVNFLLNKNSTTTLPANYCYYHLFYGTDSSTTGQNLSLIAPPKLTATTLTKYCYAAMFYYCSNLTAIPILPALTMVEGCYKQMLQNCSKIKLSTTQTGDYQTVYRMPIEGTGTGQGSGTSSPVYRMFYGTGGTALTSGNPTINTTYYTSNTLV